MPAPLTSLEVLGECATFAKAETANPAGSTSEHTAAYRHPSQHDQEKHGKLCRVVVADCGASCKANICAMCSTGGGAFAQLCGLEPFEMYIPPRYREGKQLALSPSLFRGNPGSKSRHSSLTPMFCIIIISSLVSPDDTVPSDYMKGSSS